LPLEFFGINPAADGVPPDSVAIPVDPPQREFESASARAGRSLPAINPQVRPYRVQIPGFCLPPGEAIPVAISHWRFRPYLVDERPTPFCYNMNYRML
jgi:hypothetical protein